MSDYKNQLRETFEKHEEMTPDPAEVYARVQELARGYRWRRRGALAAGGIVLGAGLVAGAINVPALLPGSGGNGPGLTAGAPATRATPSPSVSVSPIDPRQAELEREWAAYFAAGYGYTDAEKLAGIWHMTGDISTVKAEAGRRLLAGETLPVQPVDGVPTTQSPVEVQQVDAFFAAGYSYDDAATLANLWHLPDPYHAKVEGGKRLLAGQTLPIQP